MTQRIPDDVVALAAQGRMHHHYIDLERGSMANARELIRDLGREILRLRGTISTSANEQSAPHKSDPFEQGGISDRLSNFDNWGDRKRERS